MSNDPRYHQEWSVLSRYIRSLFNNHCARCFRDCSKPLDSREILQVHHIDENPGNNVPENLIPLCAECHLKIEKEARLHAPYSEIQHELFEDTSYLLRMQEMRTEALKNFGGQIKNRISRMSDEEYDDYLNKRDWEDNP